MLPFIIYLEEFPLSSLPHLKIYLVFSLLKLNPIKKEKNYFIHVSVRWTLLRKNAEYTKSKEHF